MEFSVPQLFHHFLSSSLTDPVDLDDLQQSLHITLPEQLAELSVALEALIKVGFVEQLNEVPQYRRREDDTLVVGRLRCSSKGFCFAIRDEPGVEDVYVHGTNLNGAWNGDQVLTRVTKDGNRRRSPEGEVVAVIERANPTIVGQLKPIDSGFKAVPLDDRLLFELELIPPQETGSDSGQEHPLPVLEPDKFAYIQIRRYPLANLAPLGEVLKILGSSPDSSMDIDLICCKFNLPQSFSHAVLQEAAALPQKIAKTELKKRQDYRDWLTVTIEPMDLQHPHGLEPNTAISLQTLSQGSWQLGIHIADVSHWVQPDSLLDQEARQRCRAVYLDACVLPLFPQTVQTRVALLPQQERLTLSVVLHLAADGTVQSYEIHPSVILPRAHLTYGQVQALLVTAAESAADGETLPELMSLLQNLHTVSQMLKHQRHQGQGFELPLLDLDTPHSADESSAGPLVLSSSLSAHPLMSEFLLLANRIVGEHLRRLNVPAVFQVQPAPSADEVQGFLRLASNMKLDLSLADPTVVSMADFQRFCARVVSSDVVALGASPALAQQLLTLLPAATYQVETGREDPPLANIHFGLGLDTSYGHAAAPLRRYADLLNQRALHLLFDKGKDRRSTRSKKVDLHSSSCYDQIDWEVLSPEAIEEFVATLQATVNPLNQQQQWIQQAEQELSGLKKSEYMQKRVGEVFPGLIVGVQNYGFFVQIDPILAEGMVHVSSLKNDWYEYRSRQQALVGRKSRKQFRLGDRVEVQIKNVDYYRQQIDLLVVGEGRLYEEEDS
jgi:ribonuclease R